MRRRRRLLALALLLAAAAGCRPALEEDSPAAQAEPAAGGPQEVVLLFPDVRGGLTVERRRLELPARAPARATAVVRALLAGPRTPGLIPPLPEGVEVLPVHIDADGIAYVDLLAAELPVPPASGSRAELQRVYSLVDTVLANVGGVRAVVLLWNGTQRPTFAGHVDTAHPLVAGRQLLTGGG